MKYDDRESDYSGNEFMECDDDKKADIPALRPRI